MKKRRWILLIVLLMALASVQSATAQCSICTKTSMQQGEKPASGMNSAIIYLMLAPFAVVGFVGYRWWKSESKL
jgi:flagellar basal body-associated protein FliL